ncbi:hypothetical protein WAB73_003342 [Salmonella enterica subsp. enterica]
MSSIKDHLFDMQEERRDEWIEMNYPEAEEGTPEWDAAAQEYNWFRDWMEEAAEQHYFEASLASIPDRLNEAKEVLCELERFLETEQPDIVLRMIFAHSVTVLDSFLMYSARALLNHPPHMRSFLDKANLLVRNKDERNNLLSSKWIEKEPESDTPEYIYIRRAQALVTRMPFQNHKAITRYFTNMLFTPYEWATEQLQVVIDTRNDLVHRNGVTPDHEQVYLWPERVKDTIRLVSSFIETAATTLLQEDAHFRSEDDTF